MRHVGLITIPVLIEGETDIGRLVVKQGWAKVKAPSQKSLLEYQQGLLELEKEAQTKCVGLWQVETGIAQRTVHYNWEQGQDPRQFQIAHKSKPVPAIIEQIRTGSSFRALLLLEKDGQANHQWINAQISGIQAPTFRKGVPNMEDLVEPFSEEAKYFLETRLLQRNVHLLLESVTGTGQAISFYVTIVHPAGNIAELLLNEGFAKVVDWNLQIVSDPQLYKQAEQKARAKRLRLWKEAPVEKQSTSNEYIAIVTRIISPDLLNIETLDGKELKISLSSIRGPKRVKNDNSTQTGYFFEAQEFLRSKLIGSRVQIKHDYIKPKDGEFDERICVTMVKNNKNIAQLLVASGYATVIKHRKDDNNRSSAYDLLLQTEEEAINGEKGMHSKKDPPINRIVDASENITKARSFFPSLQRQGKLKGIVEYVWSGSRFKVWIPTQNCRLTFILSGIKTPKPPMKEGQKGDEFGIEAARYSSKRVMQRDVEIVVENQDKVGGYIGSLMYGQPLQNLAVELVSEGLSSVHEYSASQTSFSSQLFGAEEKAKESKLGLWTLYDPANDVAVQLAEVDLGKIDKTSAKPVIVSEVCKDGRIFLQYVGPELTRLEKLGNDFREHHSNSLKAAASPYIPKVGDYCSAQFSQDKQWYRAKIIRSAEKGCVHVLYIDYGNSEVLPSSRLRNLPSSFGISVLKPQAVESTLAFVDLPKQEDEFGPMAHSALCHFTEGTALNAISAGGNAVLLYSKNGDSVQEQLIREGLATITKVAWKKNQADVLALRKLGNQAVLATSKTDLQQLVETQDEAQRQRVI